MQGQAVDLTLADGSSSRPFRYNPLDAATLKDPYPSYQRLRDERPVYQDRRFGWVISRYADVAAALWDERFLVRRPQPEDRIPSTLQTVAAEVRAIRAVESQWLLCIDPPRHTALRGIAAAAFSPRIVARMRDRIQVFVDQCIAKAQVDGGFDVVGDLAYPLPATIIADLLGLPREDLDLFKQWSDDIAAGFMLIGSNDMQERVRLAAAGHAALGDYMARLARVRRENPRDDMLSALVTAEVDGAQLSEPELLATCDMLLFAGHETTTNFLSSAVLMLLQHPDQLARLRADPSLMATAIEELLRFDGPVQGTIRRAGTELVMGGETIAAGDFILLLLGSANRDPEQFREPDKLDVGRRDNRHLAFSHGIHYCLGAGLARLETQVMLGTLLKRAPDLRLQDQDLQWKAGFFLRGLERLPVVL